MRKFLGGGWLGGLPGDRAGLDRRLGALVDLPLASGSSVLRDAAFPLCRGRATHAGLGRAPGFVCAIRAARDRDARAGVSNAPFGCYRAVSVRPKSNVRRSGERHSRARLASRKSQAAGIRRPGLSAVSSVRAGLRRADDEGNFRIGVRILLRASPEVDTSLPNKVNGPGSSPGPFWFYSYVRTGSARPAGRF